MNKIVPHFWFDTQATEAAEFYTSLFDNSKITNISQIQNPPPYGTADIVSMTLAGQDFMAIAAGPYFRFNPSISIRIDCASMKEVDFLWEKLSDGGTVLMPLDAYPFSKRYGWTEDRYGLSWQVMHVGEREIEQKLTPTLMFTKKTMRQSRGGHPFL
ncbi:Glyoxalase superfamily enzyme, possibly 3-demethylubiquinone-9 3-methyltransferase [Trichococcus flocculiformis]|uniref:VOC family protein n=1 Tax=Trichococcus TaxID=82802 RepID=UPI0007A9141E|nr:MULTISPECIES: VOC family protein [Trichococcus]CZR05083.1 3-demethylubiquinone-9 3-methyltransferase [Trichococcus sp. ES5]SHF85286.1 Glyoxalase superfamily enzyme, possibly 3-demethylubiquinone-9 3-methyltransferase [Trichococcus flocculiformis]